MNPKYGSSTCYTILVLENGVYKYGMEYINMALSTCYTILDFHRLPTHIIRGGQRVLEGQQSAYRDIVLANTSAVLNIFGKIDDLKEGVAMAAEAIDSGRADQTLKDYIAFTKEAP